MTSYEIPVRQTRDNAEHEGYVKASRSFNRIWKERDSAQPRLLEAILYKDNFNRAYKRVKANRGAPGIDGTNCWIIACCSVRSITVGMPSFRTPPSDFGISTRLTGDGVYFPR